MEDRLVTRSWGSRLVVAVDGPAGSGKSSVSRETARRVGFGYLDTGAAYRAIAWLGARTRVDPGDPSQLRGLLEGFHYATSTDPDHFTAKVGDIDVTAAIREDTVARRVSAFAARPEVRTFLNEVLFPSIIEHDAHPGIVVEGRDITTVVAPTAPVRVLLTASPEVRAVRRGLQTGRDAATVGRAMARRDAKDSAVVDFMDAAPGVTVVDSTHLDFEQTVQRVVDLVRTAEGTSDGRA